MAKNHLVFRPLDRGIEQEVISHVRKVAGLVGDLPRLFEPIRFRDLLDEILRLYVEENLSARDIIAHGFDEKTVRWVQRRVDLNECKREQAAPGLKVTSRAFGLGRRMPIAQKYVD